MFLIFVYGLDGQSTSALLKRMLGLDFRMTNAVFTYIRWISNLE